MISNAESVHLGRRLKWPLQRAIVIGFRMLLLESRLAECESRKTTTFSYLDAVKIIIFKNGLEVRNKLYTYTHSN